VKLLLTVFPEAADMISDVRLPWPVAQARSRENNLSSLRPQTYWKPIDCAKKYKQGDWQAVVASLDPGVRLALMRASDTGLCNDKTCEHCSAKLCSCLGHSKFCSQCGASV